LAAGAAAVILTAGAAAPVVAAASTASAAGATATATAGSAVAVTGAVTATQSGAVAVSGAIVAAGPVAWALVGGAATPTQMTMDCWKSVLRDESFEKSDGKRLQDLIEDGRVKAAHLVDDAPLVDGVPTFRLVNVWDEAFEIKFAFTHPLTGEAVLHAARV